MQRKHMMIAAMLASTLGLAGVSQGVTVWDDPFDDGDHTRTGTMDGDWQNTRGVQPVMGVESDSTLGGGDALFAEDQSGNDLSNMIFVGGFAGAATLGPNVGDQLQYSADFRWVSAPGSSNNGFRWGIYNTQGTPRSAGTSNVHDDTGYRLHFGTGGNAQTRLLKNVGNGDDPTIGVAEDIPLPSGASETDVALDDADAHTLGMTLTRQSSGVLIEVALDGSEVTSGLDENVGGEGPFTVFDEAAFNTHVNAAPELHVDNVAMETIPVPEPASLALLGAGGLLMFYRRRRDGASPTRSE